MTDWSGTSGHMQVGINWRCDGYDTNTPSINVYCDYYVRSINWKYSDNQNLHVYGQPGDTNFGYTLNTPNGVVAEVYIGTLTIGGQVQNYGGGPTYGAGAQVSGAYDGSAPSLVTYFALPARPPNVPLNPPLGVDSVTTNTARIVISSVPDGRGASVDSIEAYVCSNNAVPGGGGAVVASASGGTFTATGLAPVTTYYAFARAHNAVGWSGWAGAVPFTTGGNPPAQTAAPTVGTLTSTGGTVTWVAPANGGSAITGYDVQFADDAGFTTNIQTFQVYSGLSYVYASSGPGTKKYVRVRAVNGVGIGTFSTGVTFNTVQVAPNIPAPTEGQVRTDGAASATIYAPGLRTGRLARVQWSQDSTFATGVTEQTVSPASASGDETYAVVNPTAYQGSGTWYIRARIENSELGVNTAYSGTRTYTQSHAPGANALVPAGGSYVVYSATPNFTLSASDGAGSDSVTAYQIIVERNDTGALVTDTGKIALAFPDGSKTVTVAIAPTAKDLQLRWKVRVWDRADTAGAYSTYSIFYLVDLPAVVVTAPVGAVAVGSPTVTWTFAATSGRTQARADVAVIQNDTGAIVWQAFVTDPAIRSLTPGTTILQNGKAYTVTVKATDSQGLFNTATGAFTSSFNPPAILDYSVSSPDIDTLGYVLIDWSNAIADPSLVAWRVYRREVDDPTWELIVEYTDQSVTQYKDFLVSSYKDYLWNVTQVANRFGSNLESPVGLVLKSSVGPVRTNLIKNPNSETAASLAAATNATVARVVDSSMRGTAFSRMTVTAASAASARTTVGTGGSSVVAATQYVASFNIRRTNGAATPTRCDIVWYDAAGAVLSTSQGVATTDSGTNAIEQRWVTVVAPASAAFAAVQLYATAPSAGQIFEVDDFMLEIGNTPQPYFDGSVSPDLLNFTPAWTSTMNASTSTLTEVPYKAEDRIIQVRLTVYWIVVPDVPDLSTALPGVNGDDSTLEFESATYNVIGRGRHRDYGDRLGYTGTLSVTVRGTDPISVLRAKVEEMREAQETYWLRTPFGKLFSVALGDIGWSPLAGVGLAEMGKLSIPYEEVG